MKNDVTFRQKRRIADMVPHWNMDNCIQCNTCSLCPRNIRPFLLEKKKLRVYQMVKDEHLQAVVRVAGLRFRIQVVQKTVLAVAYAWPNVQVRVAKKPLKWLKLVMNGNLNQRRITFTNK